VAGNQAFEGALGMDFVVNLPIQVFELGAFDSNSDGLARPITVELWSRDDGGTPDIFDDDAGGEILAMLEFEDEEGTLEGGTRFLSLDAPIVLQPGPYTIVGWGYGAEEQNYNVGGRDAAAEGLTITDSPFITFVGGSRFGDPANNGQWPTSLDGGPENRYGSGNFKFGSTGDSDGDGMDDAWEDLHGLNKADPSDAALDADNDGLKNVDEFKNRTDPKVADTDGDGLLDGVETGTGIWVSAQNTGTFPTKPDTDKDGLLDGVETNTGIFVSKTDTGTNPHSPNTDGDAFSDSTEVNICESNPVDANSGCEGLGLLAFWNFDDPSNPDEAVDLAAGIVAEVDATYTGSGEGRTGEAGDYALSHVDGGTAHVPNASFLDLAGAVDLMTVSLWQKNTGTRNASSFWMLAQGYDRAFQAHIPWSDNVIYFDTAGGCCAANTQRLNFNPTNQEGFEDFDFLDDQWHHYVFVKNGETKQVWIDGILAFETPDADPLPEEGWTDLFMGSAANGGNPADGIIDDFAVYAIALDEEAIAALAAGESPIGGGGRLPFQVNSIVRAPDGITLTWASRSNREYSVEYIRPLGATDWIELDDGVASEGEATSWTDDDAARIANPDGWYRIREN